jgi:dienelactone hydrolase
MTAIALFHSVLGVRPGVNAAADLLRSHGHTVRVVDQYDGRVFEDYVEADKFATAIGYPVLMDLASQLVDDMQGGFVCAGFSNGGGMAEHVASINSAVQGVLLFSGAMDPSVIGLGEWPKDVPIQIHYTEHDPFRNQEWIEAVRIHVATSGSQVETFDYPGRGHLFTDPSLPDEYDPTSTSTLWERALAFLRRIET